MLTNHGTMVLATNGKQHAAQSEKPAFLWIVANHAHCSAWAQYASAK
jgi:hypothetical protein